MQRSRVITAAVALAAVAGAALWWQSPGTDAGAPAQGLGALSAGASAAAAAGAAAPSGGAQGSAVTARRSAAQADASDPLLVQGLRDTLEALLLEAGDVSDPAALKQRLAALVAQHFPPDLATRALALAERYVDYRVALGALNGRAPQDLGDPRALRDALQARQQVRLQFFDSAEYDALFAREAELDRYTLARLEIARNTALTPEQRAQALQAADNALPAERRAERRRHRTHGGRGPDGRIRRTKRQCLHPPPGSQRPIRRGGGPRPGAARPGRTALAATPDPVQPGPRATG